MRATGGAGASGIPCRGHGPLLQDRCCRRYFRGRGPLLRDGCCLCCCRGHGRLLQGGFGLRYFRRRGPFLRDEMMLFTTQCGFFYFYPLLLTEHI